MRHTSPESSSCFPQDDDISPLQQGSGKRIRPRNRNRYHQRLLSHDWTTKMTPQDFFNTAVTLLLEQGRPSLKRGRFPNCMYRGPRNLKCAIGMFIPDEEYKKNPVEDAGVSTIVLHNEYPTITKLAETVPEKLMTAMQCAHDGGLSFTQPNGEHKDFETCWRPAAQTTTKNQWVADFKQRARIVGEAWNLDTSVIS